MRNTSRNINLYGGVEKMDPNISIPETWAEHSNRNIQESQGIYTITACDRAFARADSPNFSAEAGRQGLS